MTRAKVGLVARVAGKTVEVTWSKRDRYQRIVGKVIYEERDVNLPMVRTGLAWWYRKYAHEQSPVDRELYEEAERRAREKGIGLWSERDPIPPGEWRR